LMTAKKTGMFGSAKKQLTIAGNRWKIEKN
jgi:hypothetical protein